MGHADDLTSRPNPGIIVRLREIIPFYGQLFRLVNEYHLYTQIHIHLFLHTPSAIHVQTGCLPHVDMDYRGE